MALEQLGGIAPYAAVVERSSRKRLRAAVACGAVLHIDRDRYALPILETGSRLVATTAGHLSHLSAALHHGWEVCFPPDLPQLVVPPGAPLPSPRIAECRVEHLPRSGSAGWATAPMATVLHCARDLPFRDALAVADSALRHEAVAPEELVAAASRYGEQARRVAAYADGRAANPFESALRALAIEAGLAVVPQWQIEALGLTLHVDLADPFHGLVLEADSWTHHGKRSQDHDRDCERYTALVVVGWRVLRFTWTQVMLRPDEVRRALRAAVGHLEPANTATRRHDTRVA